jgi:hypothetical protein
MPVGMFCMNGHEKPRVTTGECVRMVYLSIGIQLAKRANSLYWLCRL